MNESGGNEDTSEDSAESDNDDNEIGCSTAQPIEMMASSLSTLFSNEEAPPTIFQGEKEEPSDTHAFGYPTLKMLVSHFTTV